MLRGETLPADLVFLSAVHPDPDERAACHVQTAQLDGETNLKLRRAIDNVAPLVSSDMDACAFKGHVECEQPTEHFGKFTGKLLMNPGDRVRG